MFRFVVEGLLACLCKAKLVLRAALGLALSAQAHSALKEHL